MRRLIFILAFSVSFSIISTAQVNSKAIGVRGGWASEISYQHPLSKANRFEVDLGWYYRHGLNVTGVYQWVWDLSELAHGFNWYAGFGPQLGIWNDSRTDYNGVAVGIAGQIGIEFNFKIPLQLSLDYRPGWYVVPSRYGGAWDGTALGIRYKFR